MHELYDIFHILGVTLFFGGMIVSLKWLFIAEKRGRMDLLRIEVKRAHRTNVFITAPGIVLITLSGILQTSYAGHIHSQSWLVAGLILFALSVLMWLISFTPSFNKLLRIAENSGEALSSDFFISLHRLYFFGTAIIVLPLGTMALSIMKPHLW